MTCWMEFRTVKEFNEEGSSLIGHVDSADTPQNGDSLRGDLQIVDILDDCLNNN